MKSYRKPQRRKQKCRGACLWWSVRKLEAGPLSLPVAFSHSHLEVFQKTPASAEDWVKMFQVIYEGLKILKVQKFETSWPSTAYKYKDTSKGYFALKWHQNFCTVCYFKEPIFNDLLNEIVLILPKASGPWGQVNHLLRVLIMLSQNRCEVTCDLMIINNYTSSLLQIPKECANEGQWTHQLSMKRREGYPPCLLFGTLPSWPGVAVNGLESCSLHSTGR